MTLIVKAACQVQGDSCLTGNANDIVQNSLSHSIGILGVHFACKDDADGGSYRAKAVRNRLIVRE